MRRSAVSTTVLAEAGVAVLRRRRSEMSGRLPQRVPAAMVLGTTATVSLLQGGRHAVLFDQRREPLSRDLRRRSSYIVHPLTLRRY